MQKPALLRTIYAELRATLGNEVPGGDLVKLAHMILRAYTEENFEDDGLREPREPRALMTLPVDVAIRDGGWRLVRFENSQQYSFDNIEPAHFARLRPILEKYLGPTWQHPDLTRHLS